MSGVWARRHRARAEQMMRRGAREAAATFGAYVGPVTAAWRSGAEPSVDDLVE